MKKATLLHYSFLVIAFLFLTITGWTQQRKVSGIVQESKNNSPLEGATVAVKNSKAITNTKGDGKFEITVPDGKVSLIVSFVGYETKTITVNEGETSVLVTLSQSTNKLSDVVIIGYGIQKRSDLTGAISSIKGEDVTRLSTQRVDEALQGRAAGVLVLNTDGAPGGNTLIRIRGMNSINGSNNAFVVIDGLQGGDLNSLNPNDIASIEILKDASATAIFGSRGANGVILITTKSGRKGKPQINYSYNIGAAKLLKKLDLLSAADYAKNINAVHMSNNGAGANPIPIFSDADIKSFEKNGGTDWQDVIYHTAITQNHQLSISGATDNLNYLASVGYLDQDGILLNTGYKRFSLRASLKANITKWVSFGLNWAGSKENQKGANFGTGTNYGNPIQGPMKFPPVIPVYDSSGNYSLATGVYANFGDPIEPNPLASAIEPLIKNKTDKNNVNAYLEFKPLEGLTLQIRGGAIITNNDNLSYWNLNTFNGNYGGNGVSAVIANRNEYYENSNILTYNKTFNTSQLTFTLVEEQNRSKSYFTSIDASNFLVQATGVNNLGGASIMRANSFASDRKMISYLARINYALVDKYLLTASYRSDGSSVFGRNNKFGYFPSAAFAWRVDQEDFIKNLNLFSNLKLRASWGITGNQAISPYQTLARISSGGSYPDGNYPYNGTDVTDLGFYISSAANPNLKWESTSQTDLGIDIGIFNERLAITADYYIKTTRDLLMSRELPGYSGLGSVFDNVGSMSNKGIEFEISGDPLIGDFKLHTAFTGSANRTKVLDLGATDKIGYESGGSGLGTNTPFMYLIKGEPFGQMIGWEYVGVWNTSQVKEAAKYGQLPGDPHYADVNNDGKIDLLDQKVIGNSLPRFVFGWNNRITFKNFDLSFLIQGSQGNDIFNVTKIILEDGSQTGAQLLNRWTPQNQDSNIPGIIDGKTRENAALISTVSMAPLDGNKISRWVEDGSYIRLKNISIAYNLPKAITDKIHFSDLRITFSASNLITITKYSGYNPEVSSYIGNDAQLGSDYANYPVSRTFDLRLAVTF